MMRWLLLTDDFPPLDGGVATWNLAVADALWEHGHEVIVLARARSGLGEGLPYRVIGVRGPSFARYGAVYTALSAAAWIRRADRVLASPWTTASAVVTLARQFRVPVDVVAHGSDVTRPARDEAAFRRTFAAAARVFAVSHYLADVLASRGVPGAVVLPPPIDALPPQSSPQRLARGDATGPPAWVMVGRATSLKGGDRFVRLVKEAGVFGTIYGDGPERPAWEALARDLGAMVRFAGRVSRSVLHAELPAYDLAFLLPRADPDGSGAEGYGLVLAEAARHGVATVGCRTGGVPEAVGAGLILDDPDDVQASVAALRAWVRMDRGEACRQHLEQHAGTTLVARRLVDVPPPGR